MTLNKNIELSDSKTLLMVLMLFVMALCVTPSRAQTASPEEFFEPSEYEDVILAVFTGRFKLSSGIFALEKDGRYYIPVVEVANLLGFFSEYNSDSEVFSGSTYVPQDKFSINTLTGEGLTSSGSSFSLADGEFYQSDTVPDELYVESTTLQKIWPLTFDVNPTVLTMTIGSEETLPFEKIIEREKSRKKAEQRKARIKEDDKPKVEELNFVRAPYKFFGLPTIDLQSEVGFDGQQDNPRYRLSLRGAQDLGFAGADYSIAVSEQGGRFNKPDNLRLRFTRENAYDGALPLNLEKVEWGDVSLKNRDFISSSTRGRGLTFTTEKKKTRRDFDEITVEGVALPGWEVELYLNKGLLDFGIVDENGEYRFEDVVLGFGRNTVKVVLYGPQGEIEEREQLLVNRSNKLKKGDHILAGGVADSFRDFIQLDKRIVNNRPDGLTGNIYGAYALADQLTTFASATTLADVEGVQNVRNKYVSAGVEAALPNVRTQVEVLKQLDKGYAIDTRAISNVLGFNVNARAGFYNDFTSLRAGDGVNAKTSEVDVRVSRNIPTPLGASSIEVGFDGTRLEGGNRTTIYTTRQSLNTKLSKFNNTTRTNIFNRSHNLTSGRFDTNNRIGKNILWRNSLGYEFFPEFDVTNFQTDLRYRPNRDFSTTFSASHNFDSQTQSLSAQITRDFEKFLGSVEGRWESEQGATILLRASTSLAPFGYDGSYRMDSNLLSQQGPVGALAFIDKDYDGLYDVDVDEPLTEAVIDVSGRKSEYETDENGYTILPSTTRNEGAYIRISKKSIDDPYLVPAVRGYGIYPRPGVMQYVELPVIDTGAIDGTLTWQNDDEVIAGLVLQLMDKKGDIVNTSKTGVDGYFSFERVPPGEYSVRADPKSGFVIPFEYVRVEPDELFQFGNDIEVIDLSRLSNDKDIEPQEVDRQAMLNIKTMLPLIQQVKHAIKN